MPRPSASEPSAAPTPSPVMPLSVAQPPFMRRRLLRYCLPQQRHHLSQRRRRLRYCHPTQLCHRWFPNRQNCPWHLFQVLLKLVMHLGGFHTHPHCQGIVYPLTLCPPQVSMCYGSSNRIKRGGQIPLPPHDLVVSFNMMRNFQHGGQRKSKLYRAGFISKTVFVCVLIAKNM